MLLSQTLIGCSLLTAQPRVLQAQWLLPVTVHEDNFTLPCHCFKNIEYYCNITQYTIPISYILKRKDNRLVSNTQLRTCVKVMFTGIPNFIYCYYTTITDAGDIITVILRTCNVHNNQWISINKSVPTAL